MGNRLTNKTILITGGAGFIGSNLAEKLLEMNNKIVVLDNFLTGKRVNIQHLMMNPDFRLIEGDIRDYATCEKAVEGVDLIFHEAALGSVPRSIENPVLTTHINILGTVNIFESARKAQIKRIVFAASSSTYGDSTQLPKEEDVIGKPLSPYAITKYVNELYAENYARLYGMETIGLRYFNVFGRKQDPHGAYAAVIPKFMSLITKNEPPVINGDGEYSRDFTYIDNVIQANILAATTENKDAINKIYNVAVGERTTITELFEILRDELSQYAPNCKNVVAKYGPARGGDIPHSLASIERAKALLGYKPTHNMRQGLHETVKWFVKNS
ncbi:MAG: SDR family oxidoreductase [Salinivirgaceae bacterium]|nr:SDR family oxidoreductase [Salinivirgaceae bacterium]MDD4745888.1 SDR family oxidoreductase [Salinivirgaceae bacterium]MDY0278953.1 SDR family oxidoreductase [Salinivirgaceae bacterium]